MAKRTKILAIDPGTRDMGVAFLEDDVLQDYGVKSVRRGPKARDLLLSLENILTRLIQEKQPDVIALEQNHFSHIKQNLLLTLTVAKLKAIAKRCNVPVEEYAPNTVRKAVCNNGNATKRQLAQVVAARYTELNAYLESNRRWRERYYQNIFDAIAVGLTFLAHQPKDDEWTDSNSTADR